MTIKREGNKLTFVSIEESYHPISKTWAPKIPSCFGGGTGKYITFPIQDSVYVLDEFKDTAFLDTVVKLFHKLQKSISE